MLFLTPAELRGVGARALDEEFARLFAIGRAQQGLGAFLAKKSPRYS